MVLGQHHAPSPRDAASVLLSLRCAVAWVRAKPLLRPQRSKPLCVQESGSAPNTSRDASLCVAAVELKGRRRVRACHAPSFSQAGCCAGSGTDAAVRIALAGEQGQTALLPLVRSLTFPKNAFEAGQVFFLNSGDDNAFPDIWFCGALMI